MLDLLYPISQFVLAFIVLLAALKYPPVVLCIYLLFSSAESFGISCAITPGYFDVMLAPLFLVAGAVSFYKVWRKSNLNRPCKRMFSTAMLMALATMWLGLSVYANGGSMRQMLVYMATRGPHPVIIALAYWNDQRARKLIFVAVALQLFLALGSLLDPDGPLYLIQAFQYNPYAIDSSMLELRFERISSQFLSSLQLSFYAGVGVIAAVYSWLPPTSFRRKVMGIIIGISALSINYQTMSRGVWLALLIGILLLVTRESKYRGVSLTFVICMSILFSMAPTFIPFLKISEHIDYFVLRFSELESNPYRTIAFRKFPYLLLINPLFGIGDKDIETLFLPHMLPLDHAILYGWFSGLCMAILMYRAMAKIFHKITLTDQSHSRYTPQSETISDKDKQLALMLGLLAFFIGMTNSTAGKTLQFICFGFACVPWVMGGRKIALRQRDAAFAPGLRENWPRTFIKGTSQT